MHEHLTKSLLLRTLDGCDKERLSDYFDGLSRASKRRFQPHPLNTEAAHRICACKTATTFRFIVQRDEEIIAYFILDADVSTHEMERYQQSGITLEAGKDYLFAPSVGDDFQNTGVGSLAMPHLVKFARRKGARSFVLMGGTQATNDRAIAFYEKFGFQRFGGYQTDVFNHDMRLVL